MKGTHITPRQVRNALAAAFLLLLLLFLSLFQWYQRADTRLEDIAAQNGWDCLGAADRLATHLKRGTYDYMTIDAIARFDETAQHAQQPTWGQLGEVLVELENEIAFTAIPPREMQKITAYLNGLTGPPTSEEVLEISTIIRLNTYDAYIRGPGMTAPPGAGDILPGESRRCLHRKTNF